MFKPPRTSLPNRLAKRTPKLMATTRTSSLVVAISLIALLGACARNYDQSVLPGTIYFQQGGTGGIQRMELSTGTVSDVVRHWPRFSSWDISWDGKFGVQGSGRIDETTYFIFNTSTGETIREVRYEPYDADSAGSPKISPDGNFLAVEPTRYVGVEILDMEGHTLRSFTHELTRDPISFEPGGGILYESFGWLRRTTPDARRHVDIRELPDKRGKSYPAASPDGKKIALRQGDHIWMMNADGSDFHAVTQSDQREAFPQFSPDSKWLAFSCNNREGRISWDLAWASIERGTIFRLCVIPADGQTYNVLPGKDSRVIHPRPKGDPDTGIGMAIVDFLWRP
jgi:Tol biopolymer transport system component